MNALTTPQSHSAAFRERLPSLPGPAALRREAIEAFEAVGFPTERSEDWKSTNLAPLLRTPHRLAGSAAPSSAAPRADRLRVMDLAQALRECPELVLPHLGRRADSRALPFVALNTAFWDHGLFVHVPDGVVVEQPILLSFSGDPEGDGPAPLLYRRILIVLGKRSQATIQEMHAPGHATGHTANVVCEAYLGQGAILDHYKLQEEPLTANHLSTTQAVLEAGANFTTHYVGFGGALVRNEVRAVFVGERAEATVNGLYQIDGTQHHDTHTVIDHARPNCASHELYKGILGGRSHGVFNGKIFVRPDAQKTDAKQTNRTLLLSDDATINTKPQLEIYADDVKCTHGATVGQLDANQLFYLRSRGIPDSQARALLTFAFANDIVSRVRIPRLRERLEQQLLHAHHLPRLAPAEDSE